MDLKVEESSQFGLCRLDKNAKVILQNEVSKEICGEKQNQECTICINHFEKNKPTKRSGIYTGRKIKIRDTVCESVLLNEPQRTSVIFYPLETKESTMSHINDSELTLREKEIATLILEGQSNSEILKQLIISKATLKTHLNSIYKKVPKIKQKRFY